MGQDSNLDLPSVYHNPDDNDSSTGAIPVVDVDMSPESANFAPGSDADPGDRGGDDDDDEAGAAPSDAAGSGEGGDDDDCSGARADEPEPTGPAAPAVHTIEDIIGDLPPARTLRPSLFALCVVGDLDPDDPPERAEPTVVYRELEAYDAVLGFGVEEETRGAFVRLEGERPNERVTGVFRSAEAARAFYSRWGELQLVYCPSAACPAP